MNPPLRMIPVLSAEQAATDRLHSVAARLPHTEWLGDYPRCIREMPENASLLTVDDESGQSVITRTVIEQSDGKHYAPPGSLYRVLQNDMHFYCEGTAEIELPAGVYRIRAFHGPEFRTNYSTARVLPDQETAVTVRMQRWADPQKQG